MLDYKIRKRIDWFADNKINDFAPTISPAPKDFEASEIESIKAGIDYYLEKGVRSFVVQKKYMGSYCSIYLHRNLAETYFVSRNGHRIEHIDVDYAKSTLVDLHQKMLLKYPDFEVMIIASELLPWKALGGGLIEKEFYGYYEATLSNNNYLTETNLYEKIENVKKSAEFIAFVEDQKTLSNKEFKQKYPSHIVRQYQAIADFRTLDLSVQKQSLAVYKQQIDFFAKDETIHFKPFTILKIVNQDQTEYLPNSNLTFEDVNDDDFLSLVFDDQNYESNLKEIYTFFEALTKEGLEGIMIKPATNYIKGLPPCFKIRNNDYLTMIYGVNFQIDFQRYLSKRKITQKLEQSINGWEINQQMLEIPYKNLGEENYLMRLLLLKRINNEMVEKTLDPRL